MEETAVKVAVRVRPLLSKEILHHHQVCVRLIPNTQQVIIGKDRVFTFDYVFGKTAPQDDVYTACIKPLVVSLVEGYNATVFAYGQTGSGKTYTIGGGHIASVTEDEKGIIPHAIQDLFHSISENHNIDFSVKVSYIEVYKEDLRDLLELETSMKDLHIREDENGNTVIIGAKECQVDSAEEVLSLLEIGNSARHTGTTQMNEHSSRSHVIFTISICQQRPKQLQDTVENAVEGTQKAVQMIFSKFHFVDLAGSERVTKTGNTGERFKESIQINSGLLALGNVISALGDPKRKISHVPYRDAKITRILKDSLGGNAKTVMITCISPSSSDFDESLNSLKYANRARNIKNKPVVNYNPDWDRIDEMELEIKALREALQNQRASMLTRTSQVSQDWGQEKTQIRTLEEQLSQLQTECFNLQNCIDDAFRFMAEIKDSCNLTKSKQVKLQDWLDMVEGLRHSMHYPSEVDDQTGNERDEPHHITILQLKRDLKKCQDALTADEVVFSQKELERKELQDEIDALTQENHEHLLSLKEAEQTYRLQNEKMVEQHLLINQLQDKLEKVSFSTSATQGAGDGTTPLPYSRRPFSVPLTNTSELSAFNLVESSQISDGPEPRKVHTSPPTYSLERVVAGFRTRSQMILGHIEENDEVLHCEFSDHSDNDGEENKENQNKSKFRRSINRTWTRKQAPVSSVLELYNRQLQMPGHNLQIESIAETENSTDAAIENLRESRVLNMKKLKNTELRLTGAKQKVRDLAINIKMKEELIEELVKTGKDAQSVNQQYAIKISQLEQEAEDAKIELVETQKLLQELESKEIKDAAQKAKLQRDFRKKMDAAKQKVQILNKKQQNTKKLASLSTQNEKRVTELEQNVEHMRQQQAHLQKRLREEAEKKRQLEAEIQKDQQQIKELQLKTEQQQKILKLKTEEIAAIRKKKSTASTPDQLQKLEEQKKWFDEEVEKVLQQREALLQLEDDLKKRETILTKKEALQLEKSHLEIKKLRSSQALNKDVFKLSTRLNVVEKELSEKSNALKATCKEQQQKISEEVQSLQKEKDFLLKRRDSMDEKLKDGRVLSPEEEHILFQLEEGIEALEAAIEYKNETIHSRQLSLNSSSHLLRQSEASVMEKLSSLPPSEIRSLLIRYFNKVVGLRESERKLQLQSEEMGMRVSEQENIVRELESALERLNMQCDRRLTLQQKEHEQKTQLLLLHFKEQDGDGIVESLNVYETKVQQLEKDLFFYKKTSRELKKKLRELIVESSHPQSGASKYNGTFEGIPNQVEFGAVSEDIKWTSTPDSSKVNGRSRDRSSKPLESGYNIQLNSFRLLEDSSEPAHFPLTIPIIRQLSSSGEQVETEQISAKPHMHSPAMNGPLHVQKGTPVKVSRRELRQISALEVSMRRSSISSILPDSIEVSRKSTDFKS